MLFGRPVRNRIVPQQREGEEEEEEEEGKGENKGGLTLKAHQQQAQQPVISSLHHPFAEIRYHLRQLQGRGGSRRRLCGPRRSEKLELIRGYVSLTSS